MRFSALGFRSDLRIELQAPVVYHVLSDTLILFLFVDLIPYSGRLVYSGRLFNINRVNKRKYSHNWIIDEQLY